MKTLIAYSTKHGCTEKCANKLKTRLTGEIELLNLKNGRNIKFLGGIKTSLVDGDLVALFPPVAGG